MGKKKKLVEAPHTTHACLTWNPREVQGLWLTKPGSQRKKSGQKRKGGEREEKCPPWKGEWRRVGCLFMYECISCVSFLWVSALVCSLSFFFLSKWWRDGREEIAASPRLLFLLLLVCHPLAVWVEHVQERWGQTGWKSKETRASPAQRWREEREREEREKERERMEVEARREGGRVWAEWLLQQPRSVSVCPFKLPLAPLPTLSAPVPAAAPRPVVPQHMCSGAMAPGGGNGGRVCVCTPRNTSTYLLSHAQTNIDTHYLLG